jgi:hypothetical protein
VSTVLIMMVVGGVAGTIAQSMVSQSGARTQRVMEEVLGDRVDTVVARASAANAFQKLLDNSFDIPDDNGCNRKDFASERSQCVLLEKKRYEVRWSTVACTSTTLSSAGSCQGVTGASTDPVTAVQVTATVKLPRGDVAQSRRVSTPAGATAEGHGIVKVNLEGPAVATLTGAVQVVRVADRSVAGAGAIPAGSGSRKSVLVDVTGCTTVSPCSVALADPNGQYSMRSADGQRIVVPDRRLVQVTALVASTGTATVQLVAVPGSGGTAVPNPVAGSVCLWASFSDLGGRLQTPLCNTTDPASITVASYAPDPAAPDVLRPIPPGVPVTLSVDRQVGVPAVLAGDDKSRQCPQVPGMLGHSSSGWTAAAACTSWTWGVPASFNRTGSATAAITDGKTSITLPSSATVDAYTMTWSGANARPATGYTTEGTWARPRQIQSCSAGATCASLVGSATPESTACANQHCFSAVYEPALTAPALGAAKVSTVSVASNTNTTFSLALTDTDGSQLSLKVSRVPTFGSLYLGTSATGTKLANDAVIATAAKPASGSSSVNPSLTYTKSGTGLQSFEVTLTDVTRNRSKKFEIGLFSTAAQTWSITTTDVTVAQGTSVTGRTYTAAAVDGSWRNGITPTVTNAGTGLTVTPGVSNSSGVGSLSYTAGNTAAAGTRAVTLTDGGRSATVNVRVTPVANSVSITAGSTGQGSTGTATVTVRDKAGNGMAGVPAAVTFSGAADITVTTPRCVTTSNGTCAVPVRVGKTVPAGSYTLNAAVAGLGAGATVAMPVTPVAWSISADKSVQVAQGGGTTVTFTVKDGAGVVMPGAAVTSTIKAGVTGITVPSFTTDASGKKTVTISAGTAAKAGTYPAATLTAGGSSVDLQVTVTATAAALTGQPASVRTQSAGTLTVTAKDAAGNPAAGVTVTFTAANGLSVSSQAVTNSNGVATAQVSAYGVAAGQYPVTASAGAGVTAQVTVTVTA